MSFKSTSLTVLALATVASADLSDPNQFVYLNESSADLLAAGFTDTSAGNPLVVTPSECVNCYTFETLNATALKGFVEVTIIAGHGFLNDGAYVVLDINFPSNLQGGGISQLDFIDLVNNSGGGGNQITAALPADSGNETSTFDEWLGEDFDDSTVFNFDPIPLLPGASISFTFAWDLTTDANAAFAGITLDSVGSTPAPGALALLGLAGLGRRRRQK